MKISHLIFLTIFFILLLFAITTIINFKQWQLVRENTDFFSTSTEHVRATNRFQKNILYMGFGLRGYLMTRDSYFLLSYDSAKVENVTLIKELSDLISSNPGKFKKFNEINTLYSRWLNQFAEPLKNAALAKANKGKAPSLNPDYNTDEALREQENLNIVLKREFRELLNTEYNDRTVAKENLEKSVNQTKLISSVLTVLSIATGLVIGIILARHVSRQISKIITVQNTVAEATYTGIRALLPMLFEGESSISPKVKEHLEAITERIHKSYVLVQGILIYSGIGKEIQPKEELDVKLLVSNVLKELPLSAGLIITIDPKLPVIVSEKAALSQIFSNLIDNAARHHNKPNGKICISCKDHGNSMEFFVEDDGPGINNEYLDKMFDIMQLKQDQAMLEDTGIGLLIVKKILDNRKEHIKIVSEPGAGSVFFFYLGKKMMA